MESNEFDPAKHIAFTQYLMPNGRTQRTWCERPSEIIHASLKLVKAGCIFETEMRSDWKTISMTCELGERILAHEAIENGPEVLKAVDRLVLTALANLDQSPPPVLA